MGSFKVLVKVINKYPEARIMLDKLAKEYFDYALRGGYAKVETPAKYIFYDNGGEIRENVSKKIIPVIWIHTKSETAQANTAMLK